jgi:hypothetical protein
MALLQNDVQVQIVMVYCYYAKKAEIIVKNCIMSLAGVFFDVSGVS